MRKVLLSPDKVQSELHKAGLANMDDVLAAVMEPSGHCSIIPYGETPPMSQTGTPVAKAAITALLNTTLHSIALLTKQRSSLLLEAFKSQADTGASLSNLWSAQLCMHGGAPRAS
jgi:uncharacterized membrane protein YcaP (DUF421 family)